MILDKFGEFCDAVACNTGAAGTYLLGSQIDIGAVRDVGNGEELYLVISVDTGIKLGSSTGTIRETRPFFAVAGSAMMGLPPLDRPAPRMKSSCPPKPL